MPNVKYTDEFPFTFDNGNHIADPGWDDCANTYPASVGAPAADQPQVRIAGTVPEGQYLLGFSVTWTVNSLTNSLEIRWSLDGGATWETFSRAASDSGDQQAATYAFPKAQGVGSFDFVMQCRKENAQNQMSVLFMNIWYDRKS